MVLTNPSHSEGPNYGVFCRRGDMMKKKVQWEADLWKKRYILLA
jgi:hypothetical protein